MRMGQTLSCWAEFKTLNHLSTDKATTQYKLPGNKEMMELICYAMEFLFLYGDYKSDWLYLLLFYHAPSIISRYLTFPTY